MTIALRAAGAWASGSASVAPAIPAGTVAGDLMLLYVGSKPFSATINTPAGWTEIAAAGGTNGTVANGVDVGSVAWKTFFRLWQSGDANPSVSVTTGNATLSVIKSFSKQSANNWVTPPGAKGSDTTSGTAFSLTMDVNPGVTSGDMLATFATIAGNNATFGTPTLTAAGATIGTVTESPASEGSTAAGNDLESSASHALCTAGTASAAPVVGWTLSVAQTGGGSLVRLREIVPAVATPGLGEITWEGFAPTATVSANVSASPGIGELTIEGFAPTVIVTSGAEATPGLGELSIEGFAPTAVASANVSASPGLGEISIEGFAPIAQIGVRAMPGLGQLTIEGFAPSVVISQNAVATPGLGEMTIEGFAPVVIVHNAYGGAVLYTAANWLNTSFYFEVYFRATSGTVYARLLDNLGNVVTGSELSTTSASFVRIRSSALTLINGRSYRVQFGKETPDGGEFISAKLVAVTG